MKRVAMMFILLPLLFAAAASADRGSAKPRAVAIGVVLDGPGGRSAELLDIFRGELLGLAGDEFDLRFTGDAAFAGDWTPGGVHAALDRALAAPGVDVALALGYIAGQDASRRTALPRVVEAPLVFDAGIQDFPRSGAGSGVKNFQYLAASERFRRDVETFHATFPFRKLCVVIDRGFHESLPGFASFAGGITGKLGVGMTVVTAGSSAAEVLKNIPPDADAVYVLPLPRFTPEESGLLAGGVRDRGLPSFSASGADEVRRGFLLGLAPEGEMRRIARRAALNIRNILLGSGAESLPVEPAEAERLTINMKTAGAVGFHPDWATLTGAELVDEPVPEGMRTRSLESVVREAMELNPELAAKERIVAAGMENVDDARSKFLPQVEIGATGAVIDADRAKLGFGAYPERSLAGTASLTQVLWSEPARANLSIQKSLQTGRVSELEQARLDIALEAAAAYLNVLRAGTLERIRKNDLDAARSHLELARVRQTVGTSGPSEVYRWEAQIALARKAVLDAGAKRNLAEMALNRVLCRPSEEKFLTAETRLDDPELLTAGGKLRPWLNDPWSLEVFRNFLVTEGMKASPEVRRLDAAIVAQARFLRSAGYSFYSPTVALQGQVSRYVLKDGAGVESITGSLPPTFAALQGLFPKQDDTTWSVGLRASFPLFRGGAKRAEYRKAREELARLEKERAVARDKIEQRIRSTLRLTGASYAGIQLSRDAATAAGKNLELVRDAYSRGVVSTLELIDAQNAALLTGEGASNAEYDFLLDLMNTERASGRFDFFRSAPEREAFFQRLESFTASKGK